MPIEPIGITKLAAVHYYVRDLERSRKFYVDYLDFEEVGCSGEDLSSRGRQRALMFRAGDCLIVVSQPLDETARAARFFRKHPEGIGTLIFEVEDIERTFALIEHRGGTPIEDIQHVTDESGSLSFFSITTPLGDVTFRFFQRDGFRSLYPGFEIYDVPRGGKNIFNLRGFDHVTSNFQTMSPALLWMEHVLGFERYWNIEFHTRDVSQKTHLPGSGLKSVVMRDPKSDVKFANNEPLRPFFKTSQINIFNEEHRGDGVQHLALTCDDIVTAVRQMRDRGVRFMHTPKTYYEMLPNRLRQLGVEQIEEDIDTLAELGILVDGQAKGKYLLQIFLEDSATFNRNSDSGAFFFEIIQRKGDKGFGAGNFRALFESIERQQQHGASQ